MKITLFGNEFDIKTRYVVGASVLMAIGVAATAKYVADKMVTSLNTRTVNVLLRIRMLQQ